MNTNQPPRINRKISPPDGSVYFHPHILALRRAILTDWLRPAGVDTLQCCPYSVETRCVVGDSSL